MGLRAHQGLSVFRAEGVEYFVREPTNRFLGLSGASYFETVPFDSDVQTWDKA